MSNQGVGSPLDSGPVKQLQVRSEKFSERNRSKETLTFLTTNKPWIRLTSGVNELSAEEIKEVEQNGRLISRTGNSTLAKNNVLGPVKTLGGLGDNSNSNNPTYKRSLTLGFRPVPGITSATVTSKGSYGTLRETTVNFVVWTLEDLELVEKLYLRPGYSMLLEWGHSVYLDNEGDLKSLPSVYDESFFRPLTTDIIESRIEEFREKSNYNYDAVFGYVKNYSWTFRKDGGYNCTISIASKGTLIESLRVDVAASTLAAIPKEAFSVDEDQYKEEQKSPFHFFFTKLRVSSFSSSKPVKSELQIGAKGLSAFLRPISNFTAYRARIKAAEDVVQHTWIPLRTFLEIFNEYIGKSQFGDKRIEFYTGVQDQGQTVNRYVTSVYHFGLDPLVCVLPVGNASPLKQKASLTGNFLARLFGTKNSQGKIATVTLDCNNGSNDDVLNIYVNTDMLQSVVDSYIDADRGQMRNALGMIKDILSKINDNLGGVNDLDLHYSDKTDLYYVVDRRNTPESDAGYPILDLAGLRSTVLDLQLSSKLSNQVGSQIAIAAQGLGENYVENISELLKWNTGLVDRHTIPGNVADRAAREALRSTTQGIAAPEPEQNLFTTAGQFDPFGISQPVPSTLSAAEARFEQQVDPFLTKLAAIYQKLRGPGGSYDSVAFSEMKSFFRTYMSRYVLTQQVEDGKPEKGIVPVEMSLTILGISGLTVAKAFKVAKGLLPSRITDNFGFIITGLEHEIGTQWITKIRTQFYALSPSDEVGKALQAYTRGKGSLPGTNTESIPDSNFTGTTPNADRVRTLLKTLNYFEKERELSSGGDISVELSIVALSVLSTIKAELPYLNVTVTAGNDKYHKALGYTSRHGVGNAFDITIHPSGTRDIKAVENILLRYAAGNDPNFRFLNEYERPTGAATGRHFHISWGPGTEGQVNINKAKKLASEGSIKPITIR